jgi:pre-mRNA-processing factor SLU7
LKGRNFLVTTDVTENKFIPKFISDTPWYNENEKKEEKIDETFSEKFEKQKNKKGLSAEVITKFRKGACKNCGAITHNEKNCVGK